MPAIKIKWSELLHITDLEFEPEAPKVLVLTDELVQSISWLTGATRHDRKLLRCNEVGAILVGNSWDNLVSVETDELHPEPNVPDTYQATKVNKGLLVSTSTQIILIDFYRRDNAEYDRVYIPPGSLYFYSHTIFKVIVATVPYDTGTASYVGVTAFN
ncbi:MAG: hypothetical protein HWN68_19655 [Desulfobacterales bacterium]|nr:hypothetical protein [Desulfobacterales bacterium]